MLDICDGSWESELERQNRWTLALQNKLQSTSCAYEEEKEAADAANIAIAAMSAEGNPAANAFERRSTLKATLAR